ncbi:hypothetical protein DSO57_1015932 [Entomophthora muscae]|uniref:Uncharacterized protein n=1 Tax=Entomophthora muscae TaxID=34485 RepID=A0ACC2TSR9_9FUNG|nr:hypothetical protein DSO57_1015932 [Entomophthora muscae]
MEFEAGMNLVWKGKQKKVVVVGQGCRAKQLYTYAVRNGAQVVTMADVRKWADNFTSKDISESHLVMVCDKRSSNLFRISELCQQSKSLLFVLGDFDSSDVWIEDVHDCTSSEDEGYRSTEVLDRRGEIFLVGAGPGDPGLLTWHGRRVLQRAHVVLADKLIPKEILALVRGDLRIAAKYPGNANQAQEELNAWGHEHSARATRLCA